MSSSERISVIVPVGIRQAPLGELYAEYVKGLDAVSTDYEIIFVLDGRYPEAAATLESIARGDPRVSVVSLSKCFGESTALMAGFEKSDGSIILTLPGYFQVSAEAVGTLLNGLAQADVVVARRTPRTGAFSRGCGQPLRLLYYERAQDAGSRLKRAAMRRAVLQECHVRRQHRMMPHLPTAGFPSRRSRSRNHRWTFNGAIEPATTRIACARHVTYFS